MKNDKIKEIKCCLFNLKQSLIRAIHNKPVRELDQILMDYEKINMMLAKHLSESKEKKGIDLENIEKKVDIALAANDFGNPCESKEEKLPFCFEESKGNDRCLNVWACHCTPKEEKPTAKSVEGLQEFLNENGVYLRGKSKEEIEKLLQQHKESE